MTKILAIMTGGSLGAVFRYLLFVFIQRNSSPAFPFGTLAVNLIGYLWVFFEGTRLTSSWRLFIFTGFWEGSPPSQPLPLFKRPIRQKERTFCIGRRLWRDTG